MKALLADPDDTQQVFVIVESLSGRSGERALRRFRRTATGRRVLGERRVLLRALRDRPALLALPEDSLGRAYMQFLDSEGISAEGLVAASETGSDQMEADLELFGERLRDMHDLWHVVTGYQGDLIGELSILSFTLAQTWNPGIGFIVAIGLVKVGEFKQQRARELVVDAFRRGLRARWLPGVDWEALLALPLPEVRRRLQVGDPPSYEAIRTRDLRMAGVALTQP
jgi:ubiquinone biosynthesis protein COQ4